MQFLNNLFSIITLHRRDRPLYYLYIGVVTNDTKFEFCMLSGFERVQLKSNQLEIAC